jgi:hypothetical protein
MLCNFCKKIKRADHENYCQSFLSVINDIQIKDISPLFVIPSGPRETALLSAVKLV